MKTKTQLIIALFALVVGGLGYAQEMKQPAKQKLGGYVALGGRGTSVFCKTSGLLDARAAVVFSGKWAIGLTGSALNHDRALDELVSDGTYRLNAAYCGLFVERLFSVTNDCKLSLAVMTGQGTAYYQYDKPYRKEKVWTEEVIDRTVFGVQEISLEMQYRIVNRLWLGVVGSFRNTSPVGLIGTPDDFLKKASAGVTLKYVVF